MDALYKYVTTVVFAHGVVTPLEEINLYIAHVNDILFEENSFHNQCLAAKKKDAPPFLTPLQVVIPTLKSPSKALRPRAGGGMQR